MNPQSNTVVQAVPQTTPQAVSPTIAPVPAGKKILIVEDEKEYRDILTEKLQSEGFQVSQAINGQLALNLISTTDVDLILLDILMPEMDGVTFCYKLKNELKKSIPILIMTNFVETAYPDGVQDFFVKSNTSLEEVTQKVKDNLKTS